MMKPGRKEMSVSTCNWKPSAIFPNEYMVSENGVKSFTSKTYDDLRECVLSDRTMLLSEKVKNSLSSFGPRYWCPVYPEKEW